MRRFLILGVLLSTRFASADDSRDTAGIHFQAAQAAEKRNDWKTAIEEYERAYKLAPHPSVLFNMAQAYEKLDSFHKAADLLVQYLQDSPNADDRSVVKARIQRLRDRPSQVAIKFPPGATLVVDGTPRGRIPLELELRAGPHHFHAERDADYSPDQEVVLAYGDPVDLAFELKGAPAVTPSGRRPPTLVLGFGLDLRGGIGAAWDTSVAVAFTGRIGGSFAIGGKLRLIVDLDGSLGPKIEDDSIGITVGPTEAYTLFVPKVGASLELWRRSTLHLDAFAEGALVMGEHTLSFGPDRVSQQAVTGAGFGGGIAFFGTSERSPRQQYFISAAYFLLPASVGSDTGYRSEGTIDVGGLELTAGWSILLGPLATKPPASTWQAAR